MNKDKTLKANVGIGFITKEIINYKITCSLDGAININLKQFMYYKYKGDYIFLNYEEEEEMLERNINKNIFIDYEDEDEEDYYDEDDEEEDYI